MNSLEDQKISRMESTLMGWKHSVDKVQACMIGAPIVCLFLALIFSAKSDRLLIWIVCFVACVIFTILDITLQRYITEGERELFSASLDLIECKEKLASIGVLDYNAEASRRLLYMNTPDRTVKIPLALYIIADGAALAGLIFAIVNYL